MDEALIKFEVTLPDLALATAEDLSQWRKAMLAMEKELKKQNNRVKAAIEKRLDGGGTVPDFAVEIPAKRECVDLAKLYRLCNDAGMGDDEFYATLTLGMEKIEKAYAALLREAHDTSKASAVAEFRYKTAEAGIIVERDGARKLVQT